MLTKMARLAVAVLISGASVVSLSAPAQAADPCAHPPINNSSKYAGYINGSYKLRTGPAGSCSNVSGGQVYNNTYFYGWCGVVNTYGNWWLYGRIAGTQTKGWISADNFYYPGNGQPLGLCG